MTDDSKPVSMDLDNFDLPTYAEECAVWQTRAHELWLTAAANGDVRGQASALTAAFRALSQRAKENAETEDVKPLPLDTNTWTPRDRARLVDWLDAIVERTAALKASATPEKIPCEPN
jgi:hypothetical protein